MRKTSLADAKAHLSELVDSAEHRHERILILRHGKPAAAIVPVDVATPKRAARRRMSDEEATQSIGRFIRELSKASSEPSAVEDLLAGRR
jgi:antitoxin YefM